MVNFPYGYVPVPVFRLGVSLAMIARQVGDCTRRAAQCPDPEGALHCTEMGGWNLNSDMGTYIMYIYVCVYIYMYIYICVYIYVYIYTHMKGISHIIWSILTSAQLNALGWYHSHWRIIPWHIFPVLMTRSQVVPGCSPIHSWGKHPILKQVTLP